MIHQLDFDGRDKVDIAIDRYRDAAKIAGDEGLYLCFSGGKDSCVIKALADMAGVKYDAHYNVTGIDPPELVYFIRQHHPDVTWSYPYYPDDYHVESLRGKRVTMWNLIEHKSMPPTQLVRYCCQWLKETGGMGRLAVTGVRWAESVKRKANQGLYTVINPTREMREELLESDNFRLTSKGGANT